jgi:hypothetical protein
MNTARCLPDEACAFLRLLDPEAERFTFQTFEDLPRGAPVTKPDLARIYHRTHRLARYYADGAGVWVTVNRTDLKGRRAENIVAIRAVWQEDDNGYAGTFPIDHRSWWRPRPVTTIATG